MGEWTTRLAAAATLGASLILAACNNSTPASDLTGNSSGGTSSGGTSSGGTSSGGTSSGGTSSGGTSSGGTSSGGTSSGGTSSGGTSSGGTSSGGTSSGGTSSGGTSSGGTSSGGTSSGGTSSGGSSSGGSISTGSAGLLPLVTGTLNLELVDPTQPLGTGNPIQVDSGLPNQTPTLPSPNQTVRAAVTETLLFPSGSVNPSTGAMTNLQNALVAYIKGGSIFTVNITSGSAHTPTQASFVTDACGFSTTESNILADFVNPSNSWVLVDHAGVDGTCFTSDDTFTFVQLSEPSTQADLEVPGFEASIALHDSTGKIIGFLDGEAGTAGVFVVRRDTGFENPTVVFTADPSSSINIAVSGLNLIYFAAQPMGSTIQGLYRYDTAAASLSPPLYTFSPLNGFAADPASDANNFYFSDSSAILKIPRSAVAAGNTTTLTTLTGGQIASELFATANRVVGASDDGFAFGNIFSIPIASTNGSATLLTSYTLGVNRTFASITAVDPAGFVYINTQTPNAGTLTNTALSMGDDGSGSVSTPSAQWIGHLNDNALVNAQVTLEPRPVALVLDTISNISGLFGTHTLAVYNSATSSLSAPLGTITAAATFQSTPLPVAFGIGRYAALTAGVQQGSTAAQNAFFADILTANSLTPVSSDAGPDLYVGE